MYMLNVLFNAISQLIQNAGPQIAKAAASETAKNVAKIAGGVIIGGGVIGGVVHTVDKKNEKEAVRNSFNEGHKAGEEAAKQKIAEFIKTQRGRDEFLLLVTKIGVYVAKCDGEFSTKEIKQLDNFIGQINASPVIPCIIKERIFQIKQESLAYSYIVDEMESFLKGYDYESRKEIITYIDQLIYDMINADGYIHPAEQEFITNWKRRFF